MNFNPFLLGFFSPYHLHALPKSVFDFLLGAKQKMMCHFRHHGFLAGWR